MRPRKTDSTGSGDLFWARLDQINAVLAAAGYNFRLVLTWLSALWRLIVTLVLAALVPRSAVQAAS